MRRARHVSAAVQSRVRTPFPPAGRAAFEARGPRARFGGGRAALARSALLRLGGRGGGVREPPDGGEGVGGTARPRIRALRPGRIG